MKHSRCSEIFWEGLESGGCWVGSTDPGQADSDWLLLVMTASRPAFRAVKGQLGPSPASTSFTVYRLIS